MSVQRKLQDQSGEMNKHIKEIAIKSGAFCEDEFGRLISWGIEGTDLTDEVQKFAELIIQDCIDIILDSDPFPKMTIREPYGSIMENIKEHFRWHDE